jgi:hypothetical protein
MRKEGRIMDEKGRKKGRTTYHGRDGFPHVDGPRKLPQARKTPREKDGRGTRTG